MALAIAGTHPPFPVRDARTKQRPFPSPRVLLSRGLKRYYGRLRRPPGNATHFPGSPVIGRDAPPARFRRPPGRGGPVPVGTALAGGPPARSQRALLTHWAPASGTGVEARLGEGMRDAGRWEPSRRDAVHALPVQAVALAAAPKLRAPVPGYLCPEGPDRSAVAGHGVVGAVPSHHAPQPAPLLGDRLMPASRQLLLDLAELRPHPLRVGDALERETSAPVLRADMREAEERERLRFAESARLPSLGGEPSELDQPRLLGRQLQAELREPAAKVGEEPLRITLVLEAHDVVVREAHADHVAARFAESPPLGPQIEDVVQVDVREQRRNRCPLRRPLHALRPDPVLDDSCHEPLADQAQHAPVRDPVLEEP